MLIGVFFFLLEKVKAIWIRMLFKVTQVIKVFHALQVM